MRNRLGGLVLPLLASLALMSVIVMSVIVATGAMADRDLLAKQAEDTRHLVEADQLREAMRQDRVDEAVALAADALHQIIAEHDKRIGESHEQLYQRLSTLLARPAGVDLDPVSATVGPTGAPRASQTTTTTTAAAPGCEHGRARKC